jgi:hypothetical protein
VLNTPLGKLLADYMTLLARTLPDLTPEELPRLTGVVRAMVVACIAPSPDHVATARSQITLGQLEKVRRARTRSPETPKEIAVLGFIRICINQNFCKE